MYELLNVLISHNYFLTLLKAYNYKNIDKKHKKYERSEIHNL